MFQASQAVLVCLFDNIQMKTNVEHFRIIVTGENRSTRRETCVSVGFATKNVMRTVLGSSLGLPSERPETNRLYHGMALKANFRLNRK